MQTNLPTAIAKAIRKAINSDPAGKTEISSTFEILANDIADALASVKGFNRARFIAECDLPSD